MDPLWLVALGLAVVIGGIVGLRLHAFFALLLAALVVAVLTPAGAVANDPGAIARVTAAFGSTCGRIGVMIALASVIGRCLLESGAADRIVRAALRAVGEARAGLAFLASGFVLAVPIFFDTVFYLLIPLVKALHLRTRKNLVLYVIAITAGGTMTHSLVPPTPGPLLVADALKVDLATMMFMGVIIGAITATSGYLYALWINRRLDVPLRGMDEAEAAKLHALARRDERELPPLLLALLPILWPVMLIGGLAIVKMIVESYGATWDPEDFAGLVFLGNANMALAVAAALAAGTALQYRADRSKTLSPAVQGALLDAGVIILITSAGGAFGKVLEQTGVGGEIGAMAAGYHLAILPLAWGVTALVRTAQGSATVAMTTAIGIVQPMLAGVELPFHPVYIAMAIGCGSKVMPWMNDSAFWLISRMSGFTVAEMMKTFSAQLLVMGTVGLGATMLLAKFFPLM